MQYFNKVFWSSLRTVTLQAIKSSSSIPDPDPGCPVTPTLRRMKAKRRRVIGYSIVIDVPILTKVWSGQ